jgi:hypothetical protein
MTTSTAEELKLVRFPTSCFIFLLHAKLRKSSVLVPGLKKKTL